MHYWKFGTHAAEHTSRAHTSRHVSKLLSARSKDTIRKVPYDLHGPEIEEGTLRNLYEHGAAPLAQAHQFKYSGHPQTPVEQLMIITNLTLPNRRISFSITKLLPMLPHLCVHRYDCGGGERARHRVRSLVAKAVAKRCRTVGDRSSASMVLSLPRGKLL